MRNLFDPLPQDLSAEAFETLAATPGVRVERIVSLGHASPDGFWYDQPRREWVVLLRGAARLRFEDEAEARALSPGDWVDIAAHRRHRVDWTMPDEPTVWLAVHIDETAAPSAPSPPPLA
ncbi:MAG: hypothetical protein GC159_12480 [Phycisphaera sp.]|nr:hypothetical protein [Phycisphaera sp.]